MHETNRRDFLRTSSAALAGTAVVAAPGIARGAIGAGDRIRVAVAGLGGRGRNSLLGALRQMIREKKDNLEIVALSDCDQGRGRETGHNRESPPFVVAGKLTPALRRAILRPVHTPDSCLASPNWRRRR
jgi:hypothetical protein